jgi:hypothetical protein
MIAQRLSHPIEPTRVASSLCTVSRWARDVTMVRLSSQGSKAAIFTANRRRSAARAEFGFGVDRDALKRLSGIRRTVAASLMNRVHTTALGAVRSPLRTGADRMIPLDGTAIQVCRVR